mgnify:CR=1 FL=1
MKGERVAQLELILKAHPEGLRKSDIARRIGVHRSTIGRDIEELKKILSEKKKELTEVNGIKKVVKELQKITSLFFSLSFCTSSTNTFHNLFMEY